MLRVSRTIFLSSIVFAAASMSGQAQSVSPYYGLGTAFDGSSGNTINTFNNGVTYSTPKITGLFEDAGADVMVRPSFGLNADFSWRASRGNYAGLSYRPFFYDFNGVWAPIHSHRFVPEVTAGLGGVNIGFAVNQQVCDQFIGCSTTTTPVESANRFQVHAGIAARLYVADHIFLRPSVDAHWVNDFFQFGSNWVPEYTLGIGFTLGSH